MNEGALTVMYHYSRAIYRSVKDLVDPYVDRETHLTYRRAVLNSCEDTLQRLARDRRYFARPERVLFQDIRQYFPIAQQGRVRATIEEGIHAALTFIDDQVAAGRFELGSSRCRATTRKGKPCQRTPLPEHDYCPSHRHLEPTPAPV